MSLNFSFLDKEFKFPGPIKDVTSFGSGHIHDTYLVTCADKSSTKYVLQQFNQRVFSKPLEVMSNISKVLNRINNTPGQNVLEPLHIIKTINGELIHETQNGDFWRVFNFIDHSDSIDQVTDATQAYGASRAFGKFFKLISSLDPKSLFTTIPDFHNLKLRYSQLQTAVENNPLKRVEPYKAEVAFALSRKQQVMEYSRILEDHQIPTRVTHNDTKINNVLFRKGTTEGICVLDLDTIMPGLLLYDFGDMGRTFCNSVLEEGKAEDAHFRMDIFKSLCEGFFSAIEIPIDKPELDSLKIGPWWMTYIMGIRFLADFVSGDVYYKISYDLHNLDRARNQFNLAADIERKQSEISQIMETSYQRFAYS